MSDAQEIEQTLAAEAEPTMAPAPELPREVDPAMLAEIEKKLAAFQSSQAQTVSGSEAPAGPDLSQFEIPPHLQHLYARARIEDVSRDGSEVTQPTWVCAAHEYRIIMGNVSGELGKRNEKTGRFFRLDDQINEIVNGPDGLLSIPKHGWSLSAMIPNGAGLLTAVLERNKKWSLPDPEPVKKETKVAEVKDEELQRANAVAQEWVAGQRETSDAGATNGED